MGLFSTKTSKNKLNWKFVSEETDLKNLFNLEDNKPTLFFKHSTRCSISSMVLNRLEKELELDENECRLVFIDLIKDRNISNLLSNLSGVVHQSPQAILIQNKNVIYNASHNAINALEIAKIIKLQDK